jgi:hypothetical protein
MWGVFFLTFVDSKIFSNLKKNILASALKCYIAFTGKENIKNV